MAAALLVDYGRTLDARDFDGFAALFARDGVYVAGGPAAPPLSGPEAGAAMRRTFAENALGFAEPNYHLFFNETVAFTGPDSASATSQSLYMVPGEGGAPRAAMMAQYDDELVREGGRWKFARRTVRGLLPAPPPADAAENAFLQSPDAASMRGSSNRDSAPWKPDGRGTTMYFGSRTRLAAALLGPAALAVAAPAEARWVASWTAAPHAPLGTEGPFAAASYDNVTISQILRLSEGGTKVRVKFSNRYGPAPLEIGAARIVQIDADNREIAGTARTLTFGGEPGAVIPRGAPFVTDAVDVDLPDLARLKVEIYLPRATGPCTCHLTGTDELAVSPPGNFVGKPFEPVSRAQYRAFLAGIEVDSPDALGTIVAYGDSITDGVGSTPGANRRWPDVLANRLQEAGQEWAVANQAISGNRVLSPGMGESALSRFDEDVLSLPGVKYIIVFEGVNDIGNRFGRRGPNQPNFPGLDQPEITAEQMIAGYKQIVARAHEKGIRVIGSPIGPYMGASYWSEEGEAARQRINDWIVNSGTFDGVVRLDIAFADPAEPRQMRDGYHMGDHLHGSDAGLKAVGDSIDLALFKAE